MCGSDELHPYPVRCFTYRNEQFRAHEVEKGDRVQWVPHYDVCLICGEECVVK